ncbi:hypothetical protein K3495_g6039 [Podosphaera aphanis]|nr:hypothetical protein K3495_g6039 [Podosphaera aphanis]
MTSQIEKYIRTAIEDEETSLKFSEKEVSTSSSGPRDTPRHIRPRSISQRKSRQEVG